jgi:peptidoglycan/LPS O-acetylase OafA/YrhL
MDGRAASGRVAGLDGLRGMGILLVAILHAKMWRGPSGLCVLFVLSGFLITSILARKLDGPQGLSLGWFAGRRVRRLVPGLLLYLAGVLALSPISVLKIRPEWEDFLFAAFFNTDLQVVGAGQGSPMPAIRHLWSLGVEVKFYIFWPLLMWAAGKSKNGRLALIVLLLALTGATWVAREALRLKWLAASPFMAYVSLSRYDAIALGCAAALLAPLWRSGPRLALIVGLVALLGLLGYPFLMKIKLHTLSWHFALSMIFSAALCLALAVEPRSALGRWLDNPVLKPLGQWSYGMYLWHPMAIYIIRAATDWPSHFAKPAYVLLAAAFGALSWHALEKHFMK